MRPVALSAQLFVGGLVLEDVRRGRTADLRGLWAWMTACVLAAVMSVGCVSAWASASTDGFVAPVTVPRVRGNLMHAYRVLARERLKVSEPRGLLVGSSASPVVIGERPAAGSSVAPGSTVTLRVSCCASRSALSAGSRRAVRLVGHSVVAAVQWAGRHQVAWRAALGPLKRATGQTLLGNYVVRRAVLASARLTGRHQVTEPVLELTASQPRSEIGAVVPERLPVCQPIVGAKVLVRSPAVVLVEDPDLGADPPFPSYAACDRQTGRQQLLYQDELSGEGYFYRLQGTAAAGDTVALAIQFADKYNDCATTVDIYDFAKTAPLTAYAAGCTDVDSLIADDQGFAAWLVPESGATDPDGLFVHDDAGTREIDNGPIANVALSGYTLTWTNDGSVRQATLT
jgi:hypothetical protein